MQAQTQLRYYTPEEYLELEKAAEYKSEYIDGRIPLDRREMKLPVQLVCWGQGAILRLGQKRNPVREKPGNLPRVT